MISVFSTPLENIQPAERGEKEVLRNAGHSLTPQGKLGSVFPLIPEKELVSTEGGMRVRYLAELLSR